MLHKNVYYFRYLLFSALNLSALVLIVGLNEILFLTFFMLGVISNQIFLYIGLADITGIAKNPLPIPSIFLMVIKFLLLVAIFWISLVILPGSIIFLVASYIFQLIILVISIKRVVNKN